MFCGTMSGKIKLSNKSFATQNYIEITAPTKVNGLEKNKQLRSPPHIICTHATLPRQLNTQGTGLNTQ